MTARPRAGSPTLRAMAAPMNASGSVNWGSLSPPSTLSASCNLPLASSRSPRNSASWASSSSSVLAKNPSRPSSIAVDAMRSTSSHSPRRSSGSGQVAREVGADDPDGAVLLGVAQTLARDSGRLHVLTAVLQRVGEVDVGAHRDGAVADTACVLEARADRLEALLAAVELAEGDAQGDCRVRLRCLAARGPRCLDGPR